MRQCLRDYHTLVNRAESTIEGALYAQRNAAFLGVSLLVYSVGFAIVYICMCSIFAPSSLYAQSVEAPSVPSNDITISQLTKRQNSNTIQENKKNKESTTSKDSSRDIRQNIRDILNTYTRTKSTSTISTTISSSTSHQNPTSTPTVSGVVNATSTPRATSTASVYERIQTNKPVVKQTTALSIIRPYTANSLVNKLALESLAYPDKEMSLPLSISLGLVSLSGIFSGALLVTGRVSLL